MQKRRGSRDGGKGEWKGIKRRLKMYCVPNPYEECNHYELQTWPSAERWIKRSSSFKQRSTTQLQKIINSRRLWVNEYK